MKKKPRPNWQFDPQLLVQTQYVRHENIQIR